MTTVDFKKNVLQWATDRGILEHSNYQTQVLKLFTEVGEVVDEYLKGNVDKLKMEIGDVLALLTICSEMSDSVLKVLLEPVFGNELIHKSSQYYLNGVCVTSSLSHNDPYFLLRCYDKLKLFLISEGIDQEECMELAWNKIKNREGKMVEGGVFIKEEDLK